MTELTRADRRLELRLTLTLLAAIAGGVPIVLLAVLVRSNWGPLIRLDTSVAENLNAYAVAHPGWVDFFKAYSVVIGPFVLQPAVTIIGIVLLVRGRPRLGGWMLVALWGGALLGAVLKFTVRRARPDLTDPVAGAPGYSFPSGHAFGGTVGCTLLVLVLGALLPTVWRRVALVVAALAIVTVCFARVFLGVHYLSDVVAGSVLGFGWVTLTAAAFHAWRRDVGLPPAPLDEIEPELGSGQPEPTEREPAAPPGGRG